MQHFITVLPMGQTITANHGDDLLSCLRAAGLSLSAPCGGGGRCGKCKVLLDGKEVLACQTAVTRDMEVTLPSSSQQVILTEGIAVETASSNGGYLLAFDIGTTTVAGYLLEGATGKELASASRSNPQSAYGADVISRIQHTLKGHMSALTGCIRKCVGDIAVNLCEKANVPPAQISIVSMVGNPAMQQLFLGIFPGNLAQIPFAPVLTEAKQVNAEGYLPMCKNARLLIVPNISGFVGADTVACVLATQLDTREELTLLVDIGTNGEMVLGNRHRMVACSTAAGPALEGANIHFGMQARVGAIDHVWLEKGKLQCSVIGNAQPVGICGSGLVDAVAAALEAGMLNSRGKILSDGGILKLTDGIYLTQDDIRQIQLAKGAIAAGIQLMADRLGVQLEDIQKVLLAGAFGNFMNADSACRMGLLPRSLQGKVEAVGNAAGSGAKLLARDGHTLQHAQQIVSRVECIELAKLPDFARCFGKNMRF